MSLTDPTKKQLEERAESAQSLLWAQQRFRETRLKLAHLAADAERLGIAHDVGAGVTEGIDAIDASLSRVSALVAALAAGQPITRSQVEFALEPARRFAASVTS